MGYAPKSNSTNSDNADKPLDSGKTIFHWSHRDYAGAFPRSESHEKEYPDEEYRYNTYWERDKEPLEPAWLRFHVL